MGILSLEYQIDLERIFLLNPGQSLDLGDRRLTAFRPPVYDSPATTGFYDQRTGTCFTSDCFGSPLAFPDQAAVDDIAALPADDLLAGQRLWASVDSPMGDVCRPDRVSGLAPTLARARSSGRAVHTSPARSCRRGAAA